MTTSGHQRRAGGSEHPEPGMVAVICDCGFRLGEGNKQLPVVAAGYRERGLTDLGKEI
jgi:hypothetical protein